MDKQKLSKRIKEEREKLGLKQNELAQKIGKSVSNISGYEIANRIPPVEILSMLADIFDCSTDYLIGRTDYRNASVFTKTIKGRNVTIEAKNEQAANKVFDQIEQLIE